MQFLLFLSRGTESIRPGVITLELIQREVERLRELRSSGIVLNAWEKNSSEGAILLLDAPGETDCRATIATLPFHQAGIFAIERIMPVEPYFEAYPGGQQAEEATESAPSRAELGATDCVGKPARGSKEVGAAPTARVQILYLIGLQAEPLPPGILTLPLIHLEIQRIHELLISGAIRSAWKRIDMNALAVLTEASSEEGCRAIIDALPFSQSGILETESAIRVNLHGAIYSGQLPD